jgi:hypothetical protein
LPTLTDQEREAVVGYYADSLTIQVMEPEYIEAYALQRLMIDASRRDARRKPKCSPGNKPCGDTCIPEGHECHADDPKEQFRRQAERRALAKSIASTLASAGIGAGVLAGIGAISNATRDVNEPEPQPTPKDAPSRVVTTEELENEASAGEQPINVSPDSVQNTGSIFELDLNLGKGIDAPLGSVRISQVSEPTPSLSPRNTGSVSNADINLGSPSGLKPGAARISAAPSSPPQTVEKPFRPGFVDEEGRLEIVGDIKSYEADYLRDRLKTHYERLIQEKDALKASRPRNKSLKFKPSDDFTIDELVKDTLSEDVAIGFKKSGGVYKKERWRVQKLIDVGVMDDPDIELYNSGATTTTKYKDPKTGKEVDRVRRRKDAPPLLSTAPNQEPEPAQKTASRRNPVSNKPSIKSKSQEHTTPDGKPKKSDRNFVAANTPLDKLGIDIPAVPEGEFTSQTVKNKQISEQDLLRQSALFDKAVEGEVELDDYVAAKRQIAQEKNKALGLSTPFDSLDEKLAVQEWEDATERSAGAVRTKAFNARNSATEQPISNQLDKSAPTPKPLSDEPLPESDIALADLNATEDPDAQARVRQAIENGALKVEQIKEAMHNGVLSRDAYINGRAMAMDRLGRRGTGTIRATAADRELFGIEYDRTIEEAAEKEAARASATVKPPAPNAMPSTFDAKLKRGRIAEALDESILNAENALEEAAAAQNALSQARKEIDEISRSALEKYQPLSSPNDLRADYRENLRALNELARKGELTKEQYLEFREEAYRELLDQTDPHLQNYEFGDGIMAMFEQGWQQATKGK